MHPVLYLVAEFTLTTFVIGFTAPRSPIRPVSLLLIVYWVYQCIPLCMEYMVRTPWAALVGGYAVTWGYHYLDVALLNRWSFEQRAPTSGLVKPSEENQKAKENNKANGVSKTQGQSFYDRLCFGFKITATSRFVGTPYQARNTPKVVATERKHFLLRELVIIIVSYSVLDLIQSQNDPKIATKFLTVDKVPLFRRWGQVSAEELVIRSFTVLAAAIGLNCVQGGVYHICALLAVSSKLSDPQDWPPFYGSFHETYTLRKFWNIFWHQTNARKFSSIAHYVVHRILRLPRGTVTSRYLRILAAFFASGFLHLLDDFAAGVSFKDSGALHMFAVQALGMVFEDVVQQIYSKLSPQARLPARVEATIGYLWTALFLIWSVPAYMYPMMWRGNLGLNDSTIPYSLFDSAERMKGIGAFGAAALIAGAGIVID